MKNYLIKFIMTTKFRRVIKIDNKIYVCINDKTKGILRFPKCNIESTAYIGRNGTTKKKKEGDEKTPIGEFELGIILGNNPKGKNKNGLKYMQITSDMYWIDDPKSKYYNKLIDVSEVEKDWSSAEHLIDYWVEYEYLIEIKVNPDNIPGNGSAIFLHCANNKPTAGCVAVDKVVMKKLVENINEHTKIEIYKEAKI